MKSNEVVVLVWIVALLLVSGCSDPADPPIAELVFPSHVSHFSGNALTIRGNVDLRGNESVDITLNHGSNQFDAILDSYGGGWEFPFVTFTDESSLMLSVDISKKGRISSSLPVWIDTNAFLARMTDIVSHEGELFALDARLESVVRIDVNSGARKIVSSKGVGAGIAFDSPKAIASGVDGLYVLDNSLAMLARVEPVSGQRVIVSGLGRGTGPELVKPQLLVIQAGKALVADVGLDGLVEIELATGNRTLVYRQFVPDGPVILSPQGMIVQPDGTLLVIDDQYETLLEVDPAANSFRIVSSFETGEGENIDSPRGMVLAEDGTLVILDKGRLIEVDLGSGDRAVRITLPVNSGGLLGIFVALTVHDGAFFVADNRFGVVYKVDAVTSISEPVTSVEVGDGIRFGSPFDVVLVGDDYLITDQSNNRLVRVNHETGVRSVELSASTSVPLVSPNYVAADSRTGMIYLSYSQFDINGIASFDPATGTANIIASPVDDLGPPLILPTDLAYVAATHELLIVDAIRQRLVSLDIATGQRTILSEDGDGNGVPFGFVTAMAFNDETNTAYLLDASSERIFEVDGLTGRRTDVWPRQSERHLTDLLVDAHNQRLLILDSFQGEVLALPFAELTMQTLTGRGSGEGLDFDRPTQFALVGHGDVAVVIDGGLDAVVLVDLLSGNRVIQSY